LCTLTDSGLCRRLASGSYRLEDDDVGSHWLIDSGDSLMLLLTDLLLLLLAGVLSLVVVLVLSAGRRLLVVVLEAVG
jgi:hypothetical protein